MLVGDPHVRVQNMAESERLLGFVKAQAKSHGADAVVFMGDLFHNHAVLRMEVVQFWQRWATSFGDINFVCIVGNHDQAGSRQAERSGSALDTIKGLSEGVMVFDQCGLLFDSIGIVPYVSCEETFLEECHRVFEMGGKKTLLCHQTFSGAHYGAMYAPDGFDSEKVPQASIISGHIHSAQRFGKVWYPGTPRWEGLADANLEKSIYVLDFDQAGRLTGELKISTEGVSIKVVSFAVSEGEPLPELDESHKNVIELSGTSQWISSIKKDIPAGVRVVARPKDSKTLLARQLAPVDSIEGFLEKGFKTTLDKKLLSEKVRRLMNG